MTARGPRATALCLALDSVDPDRVEALASATEPYVGVFKVGPTAFVSGGPELVRRLARRRPVFLDLKLHDIPAQVAGAVRAAREEGVSYITVHAAGGPAMVAAAADAAGDEIAVLAVTVLTSLDDRALEVIGLEGPAETAVLRLAALAKGAGAHGLVCSPREVSTLRARWGTSRDGGPLLVTPGVRPRAAAGDDQARTASASEALADGADLIVVGRPITESDDPAEAAASLAAEIAP